MDLRAVIFVPALVGCVIFGFVFALFAAHYYLNVLQSTGSGAKQVVYISEPMVDNFWKVFYLGWLIGLWLGPAWFLGRAFARGPDHAWLRYALPLLVFWICYPLSQLSSLSGPSIWLPFHHDVFARLARKPGLLVGFILITAPVMAAIGLGFHFTFNAEGFVFLFVGSFIFVASAMLYARLLGRLAFALMYTRSILSRKKKKKPVEEPAAGPRAKSTSGWDEVPPAEEIPEEVEFVQPSELPPIQTPDEGGLHGYNVAFDDPPAKRRKRIKAHAVDDEYKAKSKHSEPARPHRPPEDDDDLVSYGVREAEVIPEERAPSEVVKPSELEMKLLNRDDVPKPPKQVWSSEVFAFLLQPESISVIGLLSILCILAGGMVRVAKAFDPTSDG